MTRPGLAAISLLVSFIAGLPSASSAAPLLEKSDVFTAGQGGYAVYRIPVLVATAKGTLLALCEARKDAGDWAAIDIFLRRSTDGGRTWEPARKLADGPRVPKNPAALAKKMGKEGDLTLNNPVAIAGRKDGVVHVLYCAEYARCFYLRSDDDGKTFSEPADITPALEKLRPAYDWKVIATGPGHGIALANGRLVVPVWVSTGTGRGAHRPSAVTTLYSDDAGKTWAAGEIVASDPDPVANPNEATAVELSGGRVMLNVRHESEPHLRAVAVSPDGATKWSPVRLDPHLPEPVCEGSLLRLGAVPKGDKDGGHDGGRSRILFCNPHNPDGRARRNLTVKLSYDEAVTWPVAKTLDAGAAGYCDLAAGPDGVIYCLYERGGTNPGTTRALTLAKFNLEWLTDGKDGGRD